ncbi:related to salicylate 1-monooxygenase [Phialocephala subalpina]|uniref:Related to salicylate 1-monooxygenase n=1 Tax=Phialocephala subalpina TaxID=576137 RepID=A0A1L7X0D2_9HELO|nr:related to salicylate 1-monooxygenase [Phialocephala subalpina]
MNVIIAGAGISGLATAISLRRSGHRVTIYERSSLKNEVGAAINVPPNITRFLIPWGLDPIKYGFVVSKGVYFVSPTTLAELGYHDHSHDAETFGQPLYYAHRVDLHESLKKMATDPDGPGIPVTIHLKSGVSSYDPNIPSITLQDGKVITADLVVASDGVNSDAPEVILGETSHPEIQKRNGSIRIISVMAAGCLLIQRNRGDSFPTIVGNWHAAVDKSEILELFAGYHPDLLAVINKATEVKRWPLLYRPPIRTWHKGKLVLTGDAAHPMLPHYAQGGAQGIEDGLALGLVMHGVTDASQIEERLVIYEKIRRNRAASIQVLSNFGYDESHETIAKELSGLLEGRAVPTNLNERVDLAYSEDVLQRTVQLMTEFDPSWKLPEGFFLPE